MKSSKRTASALCKAPKLPHITKGGHAGKDWTVIYARKSAILNSRNINAAKFVQKLNGGKHFAIGGRRA